MLQSTTLTLSSRLRCDSFDIAARHHNATFLNLVVYAATFNKRMDKFATRGQDLASPIYRHPRTARFVADARLVSRKSAGAGNLRTARRRDLASRFAPNGWICSKASTTFDLVRKQFGSTDLYNMSAFALTIITFFKLIIFIIFTFTIFANLMMMRKH